jgi:hypothetical protein
VHAGSRPTGRRIICADTMADPPGGSQTENAGSIPVIRSIRRGSSPHSLGAQLKARLTPKGISSRVHRAHCLAYANAVPDSLDDDGDLCRNSQSRGTLPAIEEDR